MNSIQATSIISSSTSNIPRPSSKSRSRGGKRKQMSLTLNRKKAKWQQKPDSSSSVSSSSFSQSSFSSTSNTSTASNKLSTKLEVLTKSAIACNFLHVHHNPAFPLWVATAKKIATELNLTCNIKPILSVFHEASKNPLCNGKQKTMKERISKNMLSTSSTEAQITADIIENGGSLPQALVLVNSYRRENALEEVTKSCLYGLVRRLNPKRTALRKGKQGSEDPESEWAKARLEFCSQFLVCCGVASYDTPKLCL